MSWRNPDARHSDWGLDSYGQAILDALRRRAATSPASTRRTCWRACSGGILAEHGAGPPGRRPASSTAWPASRCWSRCSTRPGPARPARWSTRRPRRRRSPRRGGRATWTGAHLAEVFAWLRPNDLIWNYWVNNYLQGKPPPAFDILYWNADTTRMTAAAAPRLRRPSRWPTRSPRRAAATMLGTEIDLAKVTVDSYVVAGSRRPHLPVAVLLPQHPAARREQPVRAVHQRPHRRAGQPADQHEVQLPGHRTERQPGRPAGVAAQAHTEQGSWWPDYARLAGRTLRRDRCRRRRSAGNAGSRRWSDAPGSYVLDT